MFNYTDDDGNFIIESGSNAVPIMKVSGSVVYISGSIIPFESTDSAFSEIGTLAKPFKELYVESASINFVDTSKGVNHAERRVKFSKVDVDNLKAGRPINPDGVVSASGDMHVVGDSLFRGVTVNEGITKLKGATEVSGALFVRGNSGFHGNVDVIGGFRVNGNIISEDELRRLEGLTATTDELNKIDGFTGVVADLNYAKDLRATGVTSTEFNKLDGYTGDHNDLNYAKDLRATGVTATEFDYLDGVTSNIQTQIDNAGGGTVDSSITDGSTNAVQNNAVHDALALKATTAGVAGDLLPDRDGTHDLGASDAEWQDLYVDGVAYTDSISNSGTLSTVGLRATGDLSSQGLHILGGQGAVNISSLPTNGLLDARQHNTFYMGVDGTYNGIRGAGVMGQVVTIISPAGRRNDFTHASTNVNIGAREKFAFFMNRNLSLRGPRSVRFIYDGVARLWYTL